MTSSRTTLTLIEWRRECIRGWLHGAGAKGFLLDELTQLRDRSLDAWPEAIGEILSVLLREGSVVLRAGRYYASAAGGSRRSAVVRHEAHRQGNQGVTELCCSKGEG